MLSSYNYHIVTIPFSRNCYSVIIALLVSGYTVGILQLLLGISQSSCSSFPDRLPRSNYHNQNVDTVLLNFRLDLKDLTRKWLTIYYWEKINDYYRINTNYHKIAILVVCQLYSNLLSIAWRLYVNKIALECKRSRIKIQPQNH